MTVPPDHIEYHLWSIEHQAWWARAGIGYTRDRDLAARFDRDTAVAHALAGAMSGQLEEADVIVRAPARTVIVLDRGGAGMIIFYPAAAS